MALVSTIIPTYRRPDLVKRAAQSVLAQTHKSIEVLVVIDGVDDGTRAVIDGLNDARTRVIETGINRGPAEARNIGVQAATGSYIALLDDDDEWTKDKIARQMQIIDDQSLAGREFLLSCRTECRAEDGVSVICPTTLYQPDTDFGEYIFDRRTPTARPGFVASGTLLMPRSLALRVPFPSDSAHEDLSWLLFCVTRDKVPFVMAEEAMFIYHLQPASRNQTQGWKASLDWARKYRAYMSGKAFSGLLSSTTAWRAKRQDGSRALLEIAGAMAREGNSRTVHWLMLGGIAILPLGAMDAWRSHRQ
jgi:glycosyltransferase involved in cell wall biosynthesis